MESLFSNNPVSSVSSDRILYTPSSFARASLLHLQEIGTLKALKVHTSSRSNLQSYLFFVVTKGSGSLLYDGREYRLSEGSCSFVNCQKLYSHTTDPDDLWSLRWCHFYGPNLPLIYEKYTERGGKPSFRPEDVDEFQRVLDDLYSLASGDDHIRDMRINEQLNSLCTLLMAESWHPEDATELPNKKASVIPVKEYLDQHYNEKIKLDALSQAFFINKYYLTRVFKEQFGMSITAYLQNVRITHAKQMLRFSDKSIEEIGMECGIGALHYFSRVFKDVEGVAPTVYRSQW
ncbi:MAG TPA: AraC family transcriptional regulator [Syntrophales bacterium]|nr:AraC family transcriptional regulator [Syntrophales bacterium]